MRIKIQSVIGDIDGDNIDQSAADTAPHVVPGEIIDGEIVTTINPLPAPADRHHIPAHYTDGLPPKIRDHYERAYRDSQLLSIRDNIALLQARRSQLLLRIEFGDSVEWRKELESQWSELETAVRTDDADSFRAALDAMGKLIKRGAEDERTWADIQAVDRDLVKWKSAEHQRESDLKVTLSLADSTSLILEYHNAVMAVVVDPDQRREIESKVMSMFRGAVASADRRTG